MPHSVEGLPSNFLYSKCVIVAATLVVALLFAILPVLEEVILFHLTIAGSAPWPLVLQAIS